MFKLPVALVVRLNWRAALKYSIGLESPDEKVAGAASRWMHSALVREAERAELRPSEGEAPEGAPEGEAPDMVRTGRKTKREPPAGAAPA